MSWEKKARHRQYLLDRKEESLQKHIAVLDEYRKDMVDLQIQIDRLIEENKNQADLLKDVFEQLHAAINDEHGYSYDLINQLYEQLQKKYHGKQVQGHNGEGGT